MELDDFKYHIQTRLSDRQEKSSDELTQLLSIRTRSVVNKLKRSLYFELLCAVTFTVVFGLIASFSKQTGLQIYFSAFAALMALFIFITGFLLNRVLKLSSGEVAIRQNLNSLVSLIEEYTKRCFQFTMCLLPVCFTLSFWIGYNQPNHALPQSQSVAGMLIRTNSPHFVPLAIYFAVLAAFTYYFTKRYLRKMFGNYVSQLKAQIKEFD